MINDILNQLCQLFRKTMLEASHVSKVQKKKENKLFVHCARKLFALEKHILAKHMMCFSSSTKFHKDFLFTANPWVTWPTINDMMNQCVVLEYQS